MPAKAHDDKTFVMADAECTVIAPDAVRLDIYDDTVQGNFPGRYTRNLSVHEMMMFVIMFVQAIERCEVEQARGNPPAKATKKAAKK
jgi:hypothetical protein